MCIHVTDDEPVMEYSLPARLSLWLFRVLLSEPGEEGLVARLCGLQIVLVSKKTALFSNRESGS